MCYSSETQFTGLRDFQVIFRYHFKLKRNISCLWMKPYSYRLDLQYELTMYITVSRLCILWLPSICFKASDTEDIYWKLLLYALLCKQTCSSQFSPQGPQGSPCLFYFLCSISWYTKARLVFYSFYSLAQVRRSWNRLNILNIKTIWGSLKTALGNTAR